MTETKTNGAPPMPAPDLETALRALLTASADPLLDDPSDEVAAVALERLRDAMTRGHRALEAAAEPEGDVTQDAIRNLRGDLRDVLLAEIKRHIVWADKNEREQRALITWAADTADVLTKRSAKIAAARGFEHNIITIGKFTTDAEKGIVCTFGMARTDENLVALNACLGQQVLLVPVDVDEFMHARSVLEPDKDQPALPLEQAPPAPVDGEGKPIVHDQHGEIIEPPAEPAQPEAAVA